MIEQTYRIDMIPNGAPVVVHVSQYDTAARRLSFELYNGGVAYELPAGAVASIAGTKPDNTSFLYAMTVSGNLVSIDLQQQMALVAGDVPAEIQITGAEGKIGSANFIIRVERGPIDENSVISETDLPIFEQLVSDAQTAANEAQTAAEDAADAAESVGSIVPASAGTTGQVLTKTANGADWADKYPSGGTAGQVLTKTANGEAWEDVDGLPAGGTAGQVLTKNSSTDGDASWQTQQSGGGTWGSITGTLSDQTDLQNALNAKANTNAIESEKTARENGDSALHSEIESLRSAVGSPLVASTAAEMTNTNKVYVYTGSETGYTAGNWYYYDGSAWTSGGVYNSAGINTDKTLSVEDMAADAAAVGVLKEDLKLVGLDIGADVAVSTVNNNWGLNGAGNAVSNVLYATDKYAVTEGSKLYLNLSGDMDGTYQWQNTDYVPSTGTNHGLIGTPVNGDVNEFVTVPNGATFLIVARLKTNTTNVVRYGSNTIEDIERDVAELKTHKVINPINIDEKPHPIMINMMPYMWANGFAEMATPITSDATAVTNYYIVSGTAGSDTLTIDNGSPLSISDIPEDRPGKAILVSDNDYTLVSVINNSGTLKVYPELTETITSAYLYAQGVSIHLTQQGYVRYTRDFYGAKKKYTDKSRYIAMYDAWNYDNVSNPLTKIGEFYMGKGFRNVGQSNRRVVENATQTYCYLYFNTAGSATNTIGAEWEVDLNYANGYVEVLIGASDSVDLLNAELPEGVSINIDLYLDDELSKRYTKTGKRVESVCLDFDKAKKGKLRITTNSGANGFAANISHIAWYVTNKSAEDSAINPYGAMSMLMDSWGVYCDNAVQTEYARLVGLDANGMAVPLTNHSVGGQTSAWGCSRFYADTWVEHPKYVLIDFGINDVNQSMTQEDYCKNMKALIDAALANNIIPVVLLVGWVTTGGAYFKYTLPLISYCAEDVSAQI